MIVLILFVGDWWWWDDNDCVDIFLWLSDDDRGLWLCWHYVWLTDDDRGYDCVDIICGWLVMMAWWWLCWYFFVAEWWWQGVVIVLTLCVAHWWWQGWWLCWYYLWVTGDDGVVMIVLIFFCGWVMMTGVCDCVDIMCGWLMMTGVMIVMWLIVVNW